MLWGVNPWQIPMLADAFRDQVSIGRTKLEAAKRYIHNQVQNHRTKTFRVEYLKFLDLHEIDYETAYVLD